MAAVNWVGFPSGGDTERPAPVWPLELVLDGVAAAGFRAIGVDHFTLGASGASPREVAKLLLERGLDCSNVGILRIGELERAAVELLAETAAVLGAPLCVAALARPLRPDAVVRELRAAASALEPAGIRIAFEFTAYGTSTTLAEAAAICEAVGRDRCGLLVDAWHVFRGHESLDDVAALDDDRIALVHVSDGDGVPHPDAAFEGRFQRLLPGLGSFDLKGFADALERAGYTGPVELEVLSQDLRQLPPGEGARRLAGAVVFPEERAGWLAD